MPEQPIVGVRKLKQIADQLTEQVKQVMVAAAIVGPAVQESKDDRAALHAKDAELEKRITRLEALPAIAALLNPKK